MSGLRDHLIEKIEEAAAEWDYWQGNRPLAEAAADRILGEESRRRILPLFRSDRESEAIRRLREIKALCEDHLDYDTTVLHEILHIIDGRQA